MNSRKRWLAIVCGTLAVGTLAVVFSRSDQNHEQAAATDHTNLQLYAELLSPAQPAFAEPGQRVPFRYLLRNDSAVTLTGLKAQTFCDCLIAEPLPSELAPGKTYMLEVSFRAPQVDSRQQQIVLTASGVTQPLKVLEPVLYAHRKAPSVVAIPEVVSLRPIRGKRSEQEFIVHVIERRDQPTHLDSVRVDQLEGVMAEIVDVAKRPDLHPDNERRLYRVRLRIAAAVTQSFPADRRSGVVNFGLHDITAAPVQIPIQVHCLEGWTAIPQRVVLKSTDSEPQPSGRVTIVCRDLDDRSPTIVETHCDSDRLSIRRVESGTLASGVFEIALVGDPGERSVSCTVQFRAGDKTLVEVPVEIHGSLISSSADGTLNNAK